MYGEWEIFLPITPHAYSISIFFEPIFWKSIPERVLIVIPRILLAMIEETCFSTLIMLVIQFSWDEFLIFQVHAIIFLTALAAKYQWQQYTFAIAWYELLPLQGQEGFLLQRSIHRVTFTDELVQTKRERRSACFWVWFTRVSGK